MQDGMSTGFLWRLNYACFVFLFVYKLVSECDLEMEKRNDRTGIGICTDYSNENASHLMTILCLCLPVFVFCLMCKK